MHEPDDRPAPPMTPDEAGGPADESPITAADAEELLDGVPLVPAIAGSIPEMKALRARCLAAGIPALIGCPPGAGKG
jgi:hypothetical protein